MKKVKLGDIASYINGYAFKPSDWNSEGREIIRIQNLTGSSKEKNYFNGEIPEKYLVDSGDVLISWSGTLGVFEWTKEEAVLNQHIFKVVFDKLPVDKKYFKYVVNHILENSKKHSHGSTMKHLTKKVFDNLLVFFPEFEKQKEISDKLTCLDYIIFQRQEQLNEFDNLVKSRFNEMFIVNEFPTFPIGDLVDDVKYGTSKPSIKNGEYKYLRMNNITNSGELDLSDLKFINVDKNELEKCIVRRGDVLFNRTNSIDLVGKTCLFNNDEEMVIAGYIIRVRTKKEKLNPQYLTIFMNLKSTRKLLKLIAKGAVNQANINSKELQKIKVPLPPLSLQNQFADFVEEIDKSKFIGLKTLELIENLLKIQYNSTIIN